MVDLNHIFDETVILRKPISGFVKGYHNLPYILIGPNIKEQRGGIEITGKIQVSPRIVTTLNSYREQFQDIFKEEEHQELMDKNLVHRTFSFSMAKIQNINIKSRYLKANFTDESHDILLQNKRSELERKEEQSVALISSPNPRFYPLSLEKFIISVMHKEL